MANSFIIINS